MSHALLQRAEEAICCLTKLKTCFVVAAKTTTEENISTNVWWTFVRLRKYGAFLPDDDGEYRKPLVLGIIDPARNYALRSIQDIINRDVHRRLEPIRWYKNNPEAPTPTSFFPLERQNARIHWVLWFGRFQTVGLKHINEQHLRLNSPKEKFWHQKLKKKLLLFRLRYAIDAVSSWLTREQLKAW